MSWVTKKLVIMEDPVHIYYYDPIYIRSQG